MNNRPPPASRQKPSRSGPAKPPRPGARKRPGDGPVHKGPADTRPGRSGPRRTNRDAPRETVREAPPAPPNDRQPMTRRPRTDAPPPARAEAREPRGGGPPRDLPGIKNPYVRFRPLVKPRVELHPTTLWDYPSQHYGNKEQGSQGYRGATPSHIIWNVIAAHSKADDLVVDPFCGSGTTLDVATDLGRRSRGFDIAPTREDIERGDARALKQLLGRDTPHVIFFDPPYADNLTYSEDPSCIGKLDHAAWRKAMKGVVVECHKSLKAGGVLAIFVCDVLRVVKKPNGRGNLEPGQEFWPLGIDLANMALECGFAMIDHAAVVRRGKALDDPRLRARAQQDKFMLRGFSHLMLFRR